MIKLKRVIKSKAMDELKPPEIKYSLGQKVVYWKNNIDWLRGKPEIGVVKNFTKHKNTRYIIEVEKKDAQNEERVIRVILHNQIVGTL